MSTALLKTPLRQVDTVKNLLMNAQARDQLSMVAARHMSPERMMRVMANSIRTTPKLGQCEPLSFLGALMQCAALGLEPNTILGHAYMIPFENKRKGVTEVQVVVGYKGLIDLARRSGHITSIQANIHYSDDDLWEYEEGTEARLRHRPGNLKGDKLHAYAIAQFKDGGHAYVVLPWAHVMSIRDGSQGWQTAKRFGKTSDTPWGKYEDEMAKKTAVRALAKYLPLSVEFVDAMQLDDARADYRGFAMDPTAGVQIEEDGDTVDGETGEVTPRKKAAPAIEDTRATQQTLDVEARKEPARQARRDDTPYTEMTTEKEREPEPESRSQAADTEQWQALVDRIAGDLLDGAEPADLLRECAPQISAMKAEAPGIHKNLVEEVAQYAPDLVGKF